MFFFVLVDEALEVLVHSMKESIDLLKTGLRQVLDLADTLVDHRCKLLSLINILLCTKIELVEKDLAHLDDLLVRKLEVFVRYGHFEI